MIFISEVLDLCIFELEFILVNTEDSGVVEGTKENIVKYLEITETSVKIAKSTFVM